MCVHLQSPVQGLKQPIDSKLKNYTPFYIMRSLQIFKVLSNFENLEASLYRIGRQYIYF